MSRRAAHARRAAAFFRAQPDREHIIAIGSMATCAECGGEIPRCERVLYRGRDVPFRHLRCEESQT